MIRSNYSTVIAILVVYILLASDQTKANYNNYPNPDPKAPKTDSSNNITCQDLGSLCPASGPYQCCDKLVCRPMEAGGLFLCLPPSVVNSGEGSTTQPKCREITKICHPTYGDYQCCEGLECIGAYPVNLIGGGFCGPIGGLNATQDGDKCVKEHQICLPYGQYNCCPEFKCVDPQTLSRKSPPGIGVCLSLKI